jgi:RNA-directed DNA polymerase
VAKAQEYIAAGCDWVVDLDLEKFFDRVNHDILMGRVAKRIPDKRVLKLIRAFLNAGVMENGLECPKEEGTPQGGPLSPLLSNLLLDELDRELESRGLRFVRYADDCNIYVRSERAGFRVMESVKRFISRRLKLKVNESKSAVARPATRKFLGFSFTSGREPKRRIAPKALDRLKDRIREITQRNRGTRLEVSAGLEGLFRPLPNSFGVGASGRMDSPSPQDGGLEAMETWDNPISGTAPSRRNSRMRRDHGEKLPWPLAYCR